ncbi:hypothetical protein HIM_06052 [Hirsutella minnesotensis 3608]|uniref:Beta-ketoacyl synthase-like N-terminal domain-containing protein n=1 Tax=Hirsutella minnesotensis 3608 TaxID=1043627 RepID=A0A0F7ZJI8_9HYPO|nr:hypothetical protein HIM_06052 [Hirsutella minnesotensis 3608]
MGLLSPDSLCYSFDQRTNGYSRGEGIVAIVIKSLSDVLREGGMLSSAPQARIRMAARQ